MSRLSGELEYRIRYDVEHDLFHAKNVFNEEYIPPTFIEYVQKLERENAELEERIHTLEVYLEVYLEGAVNYLILAGDTDNRIISNVETILHMTFNRSPNVPNVFQKFTKAKELLKRFIETSNPIYFEEDRQKVKAEAERFLSEVEKKNESN